MAGPGGLGRRAAPDHRDLLLRNFVTPTAHRTRMWRFAVAPVDQGQTGTCTGWMAKDFLLCGPLYQTKRTGPPSGFDIYRKAIVLDEFDDNDHEASLPDAQLQTGSSVRGAMKALQQMGFVETYAFAFTMNDALDWLCAHSPLCFGTNWYGPSMFTPDGEGIVSIKPGSSIVGGHAYLATGWDQRRGLMRFQNSWGEWSRKGHFFMAGETVERLLSEQGECATAVELRAT